jgi:hypothetical protein
MGGNQEKKLSLVVDLVNKTEKKFKKVYSDLEEVEKRTENTRRAMREVGAVGAVALAALAYGAKSAIKEASNLEESINAVNVVFGEGADKIHDFGKTTATSIGLATSEFNQMSTLTGALLKDVGLPMDEVAGLTTDLAQRAADMASVFNTDVKDAMEAVNQAIRGETEGIRRYAGNVTVAELEIEALAQGINKSVTAMTEQEKRLLRVSVIMKQTEVTAGDFANTSDSLANRQRILAAQFQNMSAKLGTQLIPLVEKLYNAVAPLVTQFADWIEKNPTLAKNIVLVAIGVAALLTSVGLLSFAYGRLALMYGTVGKLMKATITLLKFEVTWTKAASAATLLYTKSKKIATAAFALFNVAVGTGTKALKLFRIILMSTGIGAIIVLLGFIVAKFFELSDTVGGVGNAIKLFWAEFKVNTLEGIEAFITGIAKLLNALPGVDNALGDTIETIGWLKDAAQEDADAVAMAIAETGMAAQDTALEIDDAAFDVNAAFAGMEGAAGDMAEGAGDYMKQLSETVGAIRDEIKETYDDMASATADFQKSIGQEQMSYEEDVVNATAAAYEKKKELERELKQVRREDDPSREEIKRLENQIDEQTDIIESYKDTQLELEDEIAERRKYLRADEIEQLTMVHEKKLKMLQKEYLEDQVKQLQKLLRLKQEEAFVIASLDAQTRAAVEAELTKAQSHRDTLASQKEGLGTWIEESTSMYENYVRRINRALSDIEGSGNVRVSFSSKGSLSGRASGGPVQPGRQFMVGEKGPELFVPGQGGIVHKAGSTGGSVVNVYFTGNHFTDEKYAEEIKKKIVQDFRRTTKLSIG